MKINLAIFSAAALIALAVAPARAGVVVANAVNDFSIPTFSNGWQYGQGTAGSSFTAFTNYAPGGGAQSIPFSGGGTVDYWQSSDPSSLVPLVGKNVGSATTTCCNTVSIPTDVLWIHPGN